MQSVLGHLDVIHQSFGQSTPTGIALNLTAVEYRWERACPAKRPSNPYSIPMRVIASTANQPRSYGIGNDVPGHMHNTLLTAQGMVLIARLPYLPARHAELIKSMTAARLEPAHQAAQRATS